MKVLGVVPARYQSSRLPGKPIVDICGKPMIWWVYQQAKKVKEFDQVKMMMKQMTGKKAGKMGKMKLPF